MEKKPLVIIAGPTAVGKTDTSIALAKAIHGEIISADSMQVYKYMDIGSAKILPEEMEGIPHYLVDVIEPTEEFHVCRFAQMAKTAMEQIYAKGKIPILVGGTGFYIQAVLYDIDFTETKEDTAFRMECEAYVKEHGAQALHERLKTVDEKSAQVIHANNVKRVIRALEYYKQTGKPISEHNEEERKKQSPYKFCYFVLNDERKVVYDRINLRVDKMIEQGLVAEVQALKNMGLQKGMVSMQGLGYKEILEYLDGNCTLEEAIDTIKKETRHFAKRQLTWFRREPDVVWIQKDKIGRSTEACTAAMLEELKKRNIFTE